MPCFKNTKTNQTIEVTEDHARQVLRKRPVWEEVECQSSAAKKTESRDTSGATKGSATQGKTQNKKQQSKGRQYTHQKQTNNTDG